MAEDATRVGNLERGAGGQNQVVLMAVKEHTKCLRYRAIGTSTIITSPIISIVSFARYTLIKITATAILHISSMHTLLCLVYMLVSHTLDQKLTNFFWGVRALEEISRKRRIP